MLLLKKKKKWLQRWILQIRGPLKTPAIIYILFLIHFFSSPLFLHYLSGRKCLFPPAVSVSSVFPVGVFKPLCLSSLWLPDHTLSTKLCGLSFFFFPCQTRQCDIDPSIRRYGQASRMKGHKTDSVFLFNSNQHKSPTCIIAQAAWSILMKRHQAIFRLTLPKKCHLFSLGRSPPTEAAPVFHHSKMVSCRLGSGLLSGLLKRMKRLRMRDWYLFFQHKWSPHIDYPLRLRGRLIKASCRCRANIVYFP